MKQGDRGGENRGGDSENIKLFSASVAQSWSFRQIVIYQ